MSEVVIAFEPPAQLLSLNDRLHHQRRADLVREWRSAAYFYACKEREGGPSLRRLPEGRWTVRVALPTTVQRRRDPHNFVATAKAIVDGLVSAGYWPDDTPEHVTVAEPTLYRGADVIVRLTLEDEDGS